MLDTLQVWLVQAGAGELGHLEFLQVLCEDDLNRRAATAVTRRLRAAHWMSRTASRSSTSPSPRSSPSAPSATSLPCISGPDQVRGAAWPGRGRKCHIAQALGNLACRRGGSVTFLKGSRALAHLAGGHSDRTWTYRLRNLANLDLLLLDESGIRVVPDAQADDLYQVRRIAVTGRWIQAAGGATRIRLRDRSRAVGRRAHGIAVRLRLCGAQGRDEAQRHRTADRR